MEISPLSFWMCHCTEYYLLARQRRVIIIQPNLQWKAFHRTPKPNYKHEVKENMKLFQIFFRVLANYIKVLLVKKKKVSFVFMIHRKYRNKGGNATSVLYERVHSKFKSERNLILLLVTQRWQKILYILSFYAIQYTLKNVRFWMCFL